MPAPRILGFTMVKNEQDLIEPFVRHHLRFLDHLVVLDNGSVDDTRQIVAKLAEEFGNLTIIVDEGLAYTQAERMTYLLHQIQPRFHADYVVLLDADEFLDAPDRASFCAMLQQIPSGGYGQVPWCTFVLTPDSVSTASADPPRSILWRRREEHPPFWKAILRLDGTMPADLVMVQGNHSAQSRSGRAIPSITLHGLRLLHFPVRSREHLIAKSVVGWMANLAMDKNAEKRGQCTQWRLNFERIANGESIDMEYLCEASLMYAQNPREFDWTTDVIQETPRFDYVRRYSNGKSLGSMELIVRSWKQSVIAAHSQATSNSIVKKDQTSQHQSNSNTASQNGLAGEAGKKMSTQEKSLSQLVQEGKLDQAEKLLEAALVQHETAGLWNDWATVQFTRGRRDRAEQGYRRALSLQGSEKQAAVNLAALLLAQGRLEESMPLLQSLNGRLTDEEKEAFRRLTVRQAAPPQVLSSQSVPGSGCGLVLSVPILQRMEPIQGWLEEEEADLLMAGAVRALNTLPDELAVVEVGSYCGRSTVVLGSVIKAIGAKTKLYAIDPHQGVVSAGDRGTESTAPTLTAFRQNIAANGLTDVVETIQKCSFEVAWNKPIGFIFIDGLHDYANVSRDFRHFEPWLVPGAYIAFHDYSDYYVGVKTFVNEILATPQYQRIHCQASMMIVRLDPAFVRPRPAHSSADPVPQWFKSMNGTAPASRDQLHVR